MITRRQALTGLAIGGGVALAGGAANELAGLWPGSAPAAEPRLLAIPPLMRGALRDGARVFDLSLQRGLATFSSMRTPA